MKVVTIVQQKGGAGKTTLACMLASGALSMGKKVHCIDADRNMQMGEWKNRSQNYNWEIEKPEWPTDLTTSQMSGTINDFTNKLDQLETEGVDLVIVDTRPGSNEDTEDIAYVSDVVLVPARAVPAEYKLAMKTFDWMVALKESFPEEPNHPTIMMVLSDASPAIINAMSPNGSLDGLTKTELEILTALVKYPFCQAAIPQTQICKQLTFLGPLESAAQAYAQSPTGKLREQSILRILESSKHLAREVSRLKAVTNAQSA